MLDALDITEADAAGLAELAQHDLAMARHFAGRAQAAEDPDEANRLARSYQRAARSYRQTLALKVKLKRDVVQAGAAAAEAAAQTPRPRPGGQAVAQRLGELRTALLRLAWDEAERPETEPDETDLEDFAERRDDIVDAVSRECVKDGFCDEPLDDHVARLGVALAFDPRALAAWRDLPDPPKAALDFELDDDAEWESSA